MKVFGKHIVLMSMLALLFLAICGCSLEGEAWLGYSDEAEMPAVAVSIIPEQTFVEKVCGDLVSVVTLVPPGYSPESYGPTPQEMLAFSDADIYFSIGIPLEETNIIPVLSEDTKQVSLADACSEVYPDLAIDKGRDPHIWLSPKRAIVMVKCISDEMCELDPANADIYSANAAAYIEEILGVDLEIFEILSDLEKRSFIAFHPAFGYFADEYGLTMYVLEQNGKEATADRLTQIIDYAEVNEIKVIFYQAEVDSRQAEALAEEIGGVTAKLDPLSADYTGNLKSMAEKLAEGMSR